jgi:hypothetical protein
LIPFLKVLFRQTNSNYSSIFPTLYPILLWIYRHTYYDRNFLKPFPRSVPNEPRISRISVVSSCTTYTQYDPSSL